jgi:nanoRNase/pAp phosphatase (c-di-AMP/oligoRNAs hydrolase)
MALNEYQQAHTYLGNSKNILIIAGAKDLHDTYPASMALARVLLKSGKATALFSPCAIPEHFYFLGRETVSQKLITAAQDVVVSINTSQKPVKQIKYGRSNSRLDIHITPEPGARIEEEDIHISLSKFNYDAIVTIGVDDLESLDNEFERNAPLFYETPIINLDKNSSNERYGEVNIIEPTYSSCSEIMAMLLKKWDDGLITKDVATPLLAGIIGATQNFQNSRTNPNTLYEAAYLMSREADRQEIIKHLFKTKSFQFLKLWGIAMGKLNYAKESGLAWITIRNEDFLESGTDAKAIPLVLSELKNNFSQASLFTIFWENHSSYFGIIHAPRGEQSKLLLTVVRGEKHGDNIVFALPSKDILEQKKAIDDISYAMEKFNVE